MLTANNTPIINKVMSKSKKVSIKLEECGNFFPDYVVNINGEEFIHPEPIRFNKNTVIALLKHYSGVIKRNIELDIYEAKFFVELGRGSRIGSIQKICDKAMSEGSITQKSMKNIINKMLNSYNE